MIPRTRDDLLATISKHCSRRAILRALDEGIVENLGGFDPVSGMTGYLVKITSCYGKVWIVALLYERGSPRLHIRLLPEIPWSKWVGLKYPNNPLIRGDNPKHYEERHGRELDKNERHARVHPIMDQQKSRKTNRLALVLRWFNFKQRR